MDSNRSCYEKINWDAAYNSDIFKEIKRRRFRFVVPVIIVFSLLFFILFVIQSSYHNLAGTRIFGWVNFNFFYTMLLFPAIWLTGYYFTRYTSKNVYPLEEELVKKFGKEA